MTDLTRIADALERIAAVLERKPVEILHSELPMSPDSVAAIREAWQRRNDR